MLWTYDDNGYLISVDMPEKNICRACGKAYFRTILDAKPWQESTGDACPYCNHVHKIIDGIRFENRISAS